MMNKSCERHKWDDGWICSKCGLRKADWVELKKEVNMVKGHAKGSNFERLICDKLSEWWTGEKDKRVFWRTAGSGAMAKTRMKVGKLTFGQYGDIQAIDPIGQPLIDKCVIELKCGYKKWSLLDVLDKTSSVNKTFELFLQQVKTDQKNANTPYFMLIAKRDRCQPIIIIPLKLWSYIRDYCGNLNNLYMSFNNMYIIKFNDFLTWCNAEIFKK